MTVCVGRLGLDGRVCRFTWPWWPCVWASGTQKCSGLYLVRIGLLVDLVAVYRCCAKYFGMIWSLRTTTDPALQHSGKEYSKVRPRVYINSSKCSQRRLAGCFRRHEAVCRQFFSAHPKITSNWCNKPLPGEFQKLTQRLIQHCMHVFTRKLSGYWR